MNTQNYWNSILSSTSLRTLSTPLALYCKSYLAVAIGSGTADQVMRYSYSFTARMDESDETDNDLQEELNCFFYPTLGILRGLVAAGFSEEEAEEIVMAMWDFAPA